MERPGLIVAPLTPFNSELKVEAAERLSFSDDATDNLIEESSNDG